MDTLEVDLDLVQQYNEEEPRYTLYPPANVFVQSFDRFHNHQARRYSKTI